MRIRKGLLHRLAILPVAIAAVWLCQFASVVPASAAEQKYAALVIDAKTGKTLYARNADSSRYPASLTKMMTLYVLFEELDAGRVDLTTRFSVSAVAAAQAPSKLGLKAGSSIKVEDAILAPRHQVCQRCGGRRGGERQRQRPRLCRPHEPHRPRAGDEQHHVPQPERPA